MKQILFDFISLIFPDNCAACSRALGRGEHTLCTICKYDLPITNYVTTRNNEFEDRLKRLGGDNEFGIAFSFLHFNKGGMVQPILHKFKYANQPDIGFQLGKWLGEHLVESGLANYWDLIVPVPLHSRKEKKRGYNQSTYIANGLGESLSIPITPNSIIRIKDNETQTNKTKEQRIENVKGIFHVANQDSIAEKRLLLIDDVVTTGSTLSSCGSTLSEAGAKSIDFATLAIAH